MLLLSPGHSFLEVTTCSCLPGIHYIGRMQTNSPVRILLDQLTEGQLQWAKMPDVFDAVILGEPGNGKTYRLHSGTKEYYEELKKQFPGEDAAIEKFAKLIKVSLALPLVGLAVDPLLNLACPSVLVIAHSACTDPHMHAHAVQASSCAC